MGCGGCRVWFGDFVGVRSRRERERAQSRENRTERNGAEGERIPSSRWLGCGSFGLFLRPLGCCWGWGRDLVGGGHLRLRAGSPDGGREFWSLASSRYRESQWIPGPVQGERGAETDWRGTTGRAATGMCTATVRTFVLLPGAERVNREKEEWVATRQDREIFLILSQNILMSSNTRPDLTQCSNRDATQS